MQTGPISVDGDSPSLDCFRCGYNLHSIADDQPCPECGLLAARSRRATDELRDTPPKWLASISWGVNSILLAIVLAVVWIVTWDHVNRFINQYLWKHVRHSYYPIGFYLALEAAGVTVAGIFLVTGVFLLTRPEGYEPADQLDQPLRKRLRAAAILVFAAAQACVLNGQSPFGNSSFLFLLQFASDWGVASLILLMLTMVAFVLLLFKHLRAIATRARSAHLVEHCTLVGRGAAAAFAYAAAVVLIAGRGDDFLGPYWISRSSVGMGLAMIVAVFSLLFVAWSFYLLVRFAISFRRAAKQIHTKWLRDDRALEPR